MKISTSTLKAIPKPQRLIAAVLFAVALGVFCSLLIPKSAHADIVPPDYNAIPQDVLGASYASQPYQPPQNWPTNYPGYYGANGAPSIALFDGPNGNNCILAGTDTQFGGLVRSWVWASSQGSQYDGSPEQPITETPGNISLAFTTMEYDCSLLVSGNVKGPADAIPDSPTQLVLSPTDGKDISNPSSSSFYIPTSGSISSYSTLANGQIVSPAGNFQCLAGQASTASYDYNTSTRYWFAVDTSPGVGANCSANNFSFTPTDQGVTQTITLTIQQVGASIFQNNQITCIANDQPPPSGYTSDPNPETDHCGVSYLTMTIELVEPTVSVSGTIYAYNGSTEQGISGATVYDCTSYTTTNSEGQYSFTVNQGAGFCIRIVQNTNSTSAYIPTGDSEEIYPNGTGPPPQPPPDVCGDTTSYEWQVAYDPSSISNPGAPCGYNYYLGNNSGYNMAVTVTGSLSCEVTANPSTIVAGSSASVVIGVNPTTSMWWFGNVIGDKSATLTGPQTIYLDSFNVATPPAGYTNGYSQTTGQMNDGGLYNVLATVTGHANVSSASCSTGVPGLTVEFEPYIRVFGSDVFSGTDSADIDSCEDTSAGIYGYNNGTYNTDTGSGSTGAVLATGKIGGFTSAQDADNTAKLLDPMTFSNNPNSAGSYGGSFGTTSCAGEDYYTTVSSMPGATVCPTTINQAITGPLAPGDKYICYSTSPVTISGNITYTNLANVNSSDSDLPIFEVVVRGANLTIDTGVTELAGNYISELYNGVGGTICDTSNCTVDEPGSPDNTENTTNEDRLVVDGAFIANQLELYRSAGTLNDDSPASSPPDYYDSEEFDYSPIDWLAPSSTTQAQVQSITSLPPVY